MDHADRIPIDLEYGDQAGSAVISEPLARVSERSDGTLVIDILVPQPCVPSAGDEIVVCAPAEHARRYPTGAAPEPEASLMDRLRQALTTTIGPVEITPAAGGFQARLRF